MRRVLHRFRFGGRLRVNGAERVDKCVERFLGFRLRGLYHQRFVHDEGKVHSWRVETVIQQAFGYFQSADAALALPVGGENHLVHTGSVIGQGVDVLQGVHDVIGVEHRVAADGLEPRRAQGTDVGVGSHQHAEMP